MNKELVKDLARKRREYHQRMTLLRLLIVTGGAIVILCGLLVIILCRSFSPWTLVGLAPVSLMIALGYMLSSTARKEAKALPHVPRVDEQIAALRSDQILVRGCEQPTASPGELLRAAHEGTETEAQELLRPNESVKG